MSNAAASFYHTGGSLHHDASSYVERRADTDLYEGLLAGEFCYVLTSRQMGKSSLMARTARRLRAAGLTVVSLDLTALGTNLSPEQWYGGLLDHLARQLNPSHFTEPACAWDTVKKANACSRQQQHCFVAESQSAKERSAR